MMAVTKDMENSQIVLSTGEKFREYAMVCLTVLLVFFGNNSPISVTGQNGLFVVASCSI